MTKFTPKPITENVNISKVSHNREFVTLVLGFFGIVLAIYFMLGWAMDILIAKYPEKFEQVISKAVDTGEFETPIELLPVANRLQSMVDSLAANTDSRRSYKVHVIKNDQVNALALPGGHIIIFTGLLRDVASENELAMILGHELGHFAHQDHLIGLSRGVVLFFVSALLTGTNTDVSTTIGSLFSVVNMKFSRDQELDADHFGLDLIYKKYGQAGGAIDFFERMKEKNKIGEALSFGNTHPLSQERIDKLRALIAKNGYSVTQVTPIDPLYKSIR